MANKIKFTAGRVAGFECESGKQQFFYWDLETPCLGVRVSSTGRKTYIFEGRVSGRTSPRRVTIGDLRTWALGDAQNEARRLKSEADQGIDPVVKAIEQAHEVLVKKAEGLAKKLQVKTAWNEYIKYQEDKMTREHIERGKKWGARHLKDHKNLTQAGGEIRKRSKELTKQGVLYPLLQERMVDINPATLASWQKVEATTRANNARQGFEMFRAFWRWCALRPEYAKFMDIKAVENKELRDEVPSRKSKRFDSLDKAQLSAWFKAVCSLGNKSASGYLQCLLLTGARREEMAHLLWVDINFQFDTIFIRDKVEADGIRRIPLTPYLKELFGRLERRNEWVFSSTDSKSGRIVEPAHFHAKALALAGLPHVTIHGLRRSFISLAEWVEMPIGVVAQITGHSPSATAEKHYKSRPIELLGIWQSKYEAWILEQAGVEFSPSNAHEKIKPISVFYK
ncbi:tyrosine-type recombinase/integrase [Polynucleobacter brandtiae]|uniref:Uncharacterized protein DUF4102 n=1 Tax=Polynucleobacter brandtiae TaxID=1938816 RepID=A0A2M8VZ18_9BURK|nr:integrase family protein [Polynucleobacter brandtiae]PJI83085.1 uncharacterized protein DUF4102 [Polynucleobacter brandtiae]